MKLGHITTDGDRSKKKLAFAKKQVFAIGEANAPGKTVVYDGFTIKVWQNGSLCGGRITAPMGVVALCSTQAGIKIAIAENWLGAFTMVSDYYVMFNPYKRVTVFGLTEEEMLEDGFLSIRYKPIILNSFVDIEGQATYETAALSCTPVVMPFMASEATSITVTDKLFIDLPGGFDENGTPTPYGPFNAFGLPAPNGLPDYPYPLLDVSLVPYSSNGDFLGGRRTKSIASGAGDIRKTCINFQDGVRLAFPEGYFDLVNNQFVCADVIDGEEIYQIFLSDVVPESSFTGNNMPAELRTLMLNTTISNIRSCGMYAYMPDGVDEDGKPLEKVFICVAFFDSLAVPIGGNDGTIATYFSAHPEYESWHAFISIMVGHKVYLHNASQFLPLLASLSAYTLISGGVVDWNRVGTMLKYILPYPNLPGVMYIYFAWKPHDSVMFHGPSGAYTWTRRLGGFRFDINGISAVTLVVPADIISHPGTRPDITYAGNGTYICVCNNPGISVRSVLHGSPFSAWYALPGPPDNYMFAYIRPVEAAGEQILLIGVVQYVPPDGSGEDPRYNFAVLNYQNADTGIDEYDKWQVAGKLPFDVATEGDVFALGMFGDGAMVGALTKYPSPPPAVPQNIVVPYAGYTRWIP